MEKIEYFNSLVDAVMKDYDIKDYDKTFLQHNENLTYKIKDRINNKNYLLRIHMPSTVGLVGIQHSYEGLKSEIELINCLNKTSTLRLQEPIKNLNESFISQLCDNINLSTYYVTLFTWLEGDIYENLSGDLANITTKFGETIANFHQLSIKNLSNLNLNRPVYEWEKYYNYLCKLSYGVEKEIIAVEDYTVLKETMEFIRQLIANYEKNPNTWGLIHADLQGSNVIIDEKDQIGLIDFSFSGYGFYLFDVADALATMDKTLRQAFINGYTSVRLIHNEDYYLISGFMIMTYIAAYSFHIYNSSSHEWIKSNVPFIAKEICKPFMNGENVIYKIQI